MACSAVSDKAIGKISIEKCTLTKLMAVPSRRSHFDTKEMPMQLVYDVIEDVYDDTTQIRTMTEQAKISPGDWLIRTTVYTPHHISMNVTHVRGKKSKKSLFKPLR
jgi:hypothetical protein